MDFSPLNEEARTQLEALQGWQQTLARAKLSEMLAELRLKFNDQALKEVQSDPSFRDQEKRLQIAILGAMSSVRSKELARLGEAQTWLSSAPEKIAQHRQYFNHMGGISHD